MIEFLTPYISEIILAISGLGAWLFERNKRKEDLKSAQMQNIQAVVDLYQEALSDLKTRYDGTISDLQIDNARIIEKLKQQYDSKFMELDKSLKSLRQNVDLWKGKYRKLKEEFDEYRLQHEKQ